MTVRAGGPPPAVLAAFGLAGAVVPLPGGTGGSVRVGDAVLKPVTGAGADEEEAAWCAAVIERVAAAADGADRPAFRVARPLRAAGGGFVAGGWTAARAVAGAAEPGRWAELLDAARAFHAALRGVPRPALLDRPRHRWALADRVAWREADADPLPAVAGPLRRLLAVVATAPPGRQPAQLVHGDLSGNVLFAPGLPPAVIDFSPYWRPVGWAEAVVVADALLWYGAGRDTVELIAGHGGWPWLLARALVFRLVTVNELARTDPGALAELPAYGPPTELVERAVRTPGCAPR